MKRLRTQFSIRLLSFVKDNLDFSTKDLRWSIEHGRCFVNRRVERFSSTSLHKGDEVLIWPTKRPSFQREKKRVLYEDEELLFYNKPPYISSSDLAKVLGVTLVHRLDRDTTGVILFAKKDPAPYMDLFRKRRAKKTYHALVSLDKNLSKQAGTFSAKMKKIGSRQGAVIWGLSSHGVWSKTLWECEESNKNVALFRCHPLTGRTHQIRVHLKAMGYPILGDCEYGTRKGNAELFRPLLHATELTLDNLSVSAPFPIDFIQWKERLI